MRMEEAKEARFEVAINAGARWFAVRSATRRERDLVTDLTRLARKHGVVLEGWYPKARYWRRARTVSTPAERPLFPGFVFVLTTERALHLVHDADGFHQVVRWYGGDGMLAPLVLPDVAIGDLIMREEIGDFDETRRARNKFKPEKGATVQAIKGRWAGLVARVLSASPRERRMLLEFENLDLPPVSVAYGAVRPVEIPEWACAKDESDAPSPVDDRLGQMRQEKLSQRDGPIQPPERR